MREVTVQIDAETARRVQEFADSIGISFETAASRMLNIAAAVRESMTSKGLLAAGDEGHFVVSFERHPDGIRDVDFTRVT